MSSPCATNADTKPLPKGWEWVPLGKYVENHDGRRIPISKKERESRSGLFPYYGASGVIDTIDGFTHDGEFLLIGEDGANLLTRSKPLAFLTKGKVWVNNHAHVLRCKPGYPNAYLAYFINSIDLSQYVTGTAQPKLSQSMMNKILIPVAPLEHQHEIVAEIEKQFSRLDEAVANLQRVKANLKRYKASVLNAAATGGFGEYRDESLLKWERTTLGSIADVIDPNPSHRMPKYFAEGYSLISTENFFGEEGIDFNKGKKVGADTLNRQRRLFAVETGDFVLSRIGTIGKTRFLPLDRDYCLSHALVVIKVNTSRVDKRWLRHVISSRSVLSQAREGVQSVGVPDLGMGKIRGFEIAIPSIEEQLRISGEVDRRLSIIHEVEAEVDTNLRRSQALRLATLAKAFSNR